MVGILSSFVINKALEHRGIIYTSSKKPEITPPEKKLNYTARFDANLEDPLKSQKTIKYHIPRHKL